MCKTEKKNHAYKSEYRWFLKEHFLHLFFGLLTLCDLVILLLTPPKKKLHLFLCNFLIFCFSPSTVLLIVAGGLQYAYPYSVNMVVVLMLLVVATVIFTIICLFCTQNTQLKVAKVFTFAFAVIMSIVAVGLVLQVRKSQKF